MLDRLSRLYMSHRNLVLYGVIGLSGATLDLILYILLYRYLGIMPFFASFISVSAGIVNNFFWNNTHNFKTKGHFWSRLTSFYVTGLGGAVLSSILIFIFFDVIGMSALSAKILTIPPVVLLQFLINKRISFSDDPNKVFRQVRALLKLYWLDAVVIAISAFFFFSAIFYLFGTDDIDNLLGGKLILEGSLPYRDFFSHHAPGMYYLSSILYLFSGSDIFIYRLLFNLLTFGFLLTTYTLVRQRVSRIASAVFILLASVGHLVAFSHLPLGEALIAQILPLVLMLVLFPRGSFLSWKNGLIVSILLFLIPFVSLAYVFPAALIYALVCLRAIQEAWPKKSVKPAIALGGILFAPYALIGLFMLITRSMGYAVYDLVTFNSLYYAPMVGESGGSILHLLTTIVGNSIEQVIHVFTHLNQADYRIPAILLVAFCFLAIYLWRKANRAGAALIILILLVISPRSNIFNNPAIQTPIDILAQHAAAYIGVAFLASAIGYTMLASTIRRQALSSITKGIGLVAILLIVSAAFLHWQSTMDAVFIRKNSESYYATSKLVKERANATFINKFVSSNEYAWSGPSDFISQLYFQPERATRYTFYMPWLDASPKIRQDFVAGLKRDKPTVLYFGSYILLGKPYNYSQEVTSYLKANYFTSPDQRLEGYYFSINHKQELLKEIEQNGYQAY